MGKPKNIPGGNKSLDSEERQKLKTRLAALIEATESKQKKPLLKHNPETVKESRAKDKTLRSMGKTYQKPLQHNVQKAAKLNGVVNTKKSNVPQESKGINDDSKKKRKVSNNNGNAIFNSDNSKAKNVNISSHNNSIHSSSSKNSVFSKKSNKISKENGQIQNSNQPQNSDKSKNQNKNNNNRKHNSMPGKSFSDTPVKFQQSKKRKKPEDTLFNASKNQAKKLKKKVELDSDASSESEESYRDTENQKINDFLVGFNGQEKNQSGSVNDDAMSQCSEEINTFDKDSATASATELKKFTGNNSDISEETDSDYEEEYYFDSETETEEEEDESDYTLEENSSYNEDFDDTYEEEEDVTDVFDSDVDSTQSSDYLEHQDDLVIHKGTATCRPLLPEDNIKFESDNENPQIIEIEDKATKPVQHLQINHFKQRVRKLSAVDNSSDCPMLVHINNTEESMEEFEETESNCLESFSDGSWVEDSSFDEEDVNKKYLKTSNGSHYSSDDDVDEHQQIKAYVINAVNCDYDFEDQLDQETSNYTSEESVENESLSEGLNKFADANHKTVIKMIVLDNEKEHKSKSLKKNISKKSKKENNKKNLASSDALSAESNEHQIEKSSANASGSVILNSTIQSNGIVSIDHTSKFQPKQLVTDESFLDNDLNESTFSKRVSPISTTFRTIFLRSIDSNQVIVLLKDPFYIYGTIKLTLLAGSIEVYGYTPSQGKTFEIFSPKGCSAVQICPKHNTHTTKAEVQKKLKPFRSCSFLNADLDEIINNFNEEEDAIIMLNRNNFRKKLVKNFKLYMNENVFPRLNCASTQRPLYATEQVLRALINSTTDKALNIEKNWGQVQLQANSKIMLVGGKSVGKSTMLRYLLNKHLDQFKKILVIDLDIGQSELFVPQTISCTVLDQPLLGPGFFLNLQPLKAYMIGHTNVVLCALTYMSAVKKLVEFCYKNPELKKMPWLINTMGYNKGFGLELVTVVTELLRPTDIIQIMSKKDINNFDNLLRSDVLATVSRDIYRGEEFKSTNHDSNDTFNHLLYVLDSAVMQESRFLKDWAMSPKDLRYSMILSRLSSCLAENEEWLTDCNPIWCHLNDLKIISMHTPEESREILIKAIELNLVYLCCLEQSNHENEAVECVGIGVVRSVDYNLERVYIIPADVPEELLKNVNCLVLGEIPLPTAMLTNQGPRVTGVAPFVYNTLSANTSRSVRQIHHRPEKFLSGKHKDLSLQN